MTAKPTDVDGYLATLPVDARARLEELRRIVKAVAPSAVEGISYGMPAYKYQGKGLICFGAWKNHCAVYGMNAEAHREQLAAYEVAKGTIRFPLREPLPEPLVRSLVNMRIADIEAAAAARKGQRKSSGDVAPA